MSDRSSLLIIKIHHFIRKYVKNSIAASIIFPALPAVIIAVFLQYFYNYQILTRGISCALLWMAIAPGLIQNSYYSVDYFFDTHKFLFNDLNEYNYLKSCYLNNFDHNKLIILNYGLAILASTVVTVTRFYTAPTVIQAWTFICFFIIFYFSTIGFRGIIMVPKIISHICSVNLIFNPYHHDEFGGMKSIEKFIIKGILYFSTGALLFPLVFSILRHAEYSNLYLDYSVYILTSIFITVLLYSFITPIMIIKKYVVKEKQKLIHQSQENLDKLYDQAVSSSGNLNKSANVYLYNELYHKKIMAIKEFPYDASVFFELIISILLPIIIAAVEILYKVEITV
ncbi:MAG TPA: hypothetical protein QF753_06460 [Victivallales bacterium]|nr:hypothetical protein [Victivallales bacterium]